MRVRTVYFKVRDLKPVQNWWRTFLGCEPTQGFAEWCEFRVGDTNLGLLSLATYVPGSTRPSCVPVFEFSDGEIVAVIARAKKLGATALLEGEAHPDYPNVAAVLVDPFGNEFEVTNYHG
jgi:Glyoxalase-like domain